MAQKNHHESFWIALVVDVVGVRGLHGLDLLRVCNDLDVGLRVGAALHVPPQHAPSRRPLLPAARAKHDPVHCQRGVLLVLLEKAMQRRATARVQVLQ